MAADRLAEGFAGGLDGRTKAVICDIDQYPNQEYSVIAIEFGEAHRKKTGYYYLTHMP